MTLLVTLQEVKDHLRYLDDDHDGECEALRAMASAAVMRHLKFDSLPDAWNDPLGSPSGNGVPADVKAAVLLIAGELDRNRSASLADLFSDSVRWLLAKYRDPSLA